MNHVKRIPGPTLTQKGNQILAEVLAEIKKLTFKLQRKIKEEKLSGQVLNVRSGRLRRSVNAKISEDGAVGTVGTNVVYAPPFEFGLSKDEQVRGHMRTIKAAWGKALKEPKTIAVMAHKRHVDIKARRPFGSALDEIKKDMGKDIAAAVVRGNNASS